MANIDEIKFIQNKIDYLYEKLEEISFGSNDFALVNKLELEIKELEDELIRKTEPTCSNGIIDLYLDENNSCDEQELYIIRLAGEVDKIGQIEVRYGFVPILGNVGYHLNEEYRGHGYMFQALETLEDILIDKGLEKPIFTVYPENVPSVRTIEKLGGVKIFDEDGYKHYDTYEVDLIEKKTR